MTTILFAMSWLVIFPAVHMASWGIMVANGVNYPHFTDIPYSETLPYQAGIIVVCCTTMGFLKFVFGRFYNFLQKVEVTAGNQPNA